MTPGIHALSPDVGGTVDYLISVPGDIEGAWLTGLEGLSVLSVQLRFLYGSGSGGVRACIQSSLDQGQSVFDVAIVDFAASARSALFTIRPATTALIIPSLDGGRGSSPLAAEGIASTVLGDRLRLKALVDGSYSNTTLAARVLIG